MDLESGKRQFITYIKKFQYFLIILAVGVLIMLIPVGETESEEATAPEIPIRSDLEEELEEILSQISGVGKTEVLLTEFSGSETIYQSDSGYNLSGNDTVILTDSNRSQYGLVRQILSPVYKGAVVVCKGADSASVRLAVVDAVMRATGLSSDCISVLKMK